MGHNVEVLQLRVIRLTDTPPYPYSNQINSTEIPHQLLSGKNKKYKQHFCGICPITQQMGRTCRTWTQIF